MQSMKLDTPPYTSIFKVGPFSFHRPKHTHTHTQKLNSNIWNRISKRSPMVSRLHFRTAGLVYSVYTEILNEIYGQINLRTDTTVLTNNTLQRLANQT